MKQAGQSTKTPLHNSFNPITILKGFIFSYLITIPAFTIFALILANTNFPEKLMSPAVVIITVISVFTASYIVARSTKSKGMINGSIVGFLYMLLLYILSSIVYKNFKIDRYSITMVLIGVLTGAIGGILGTNVKKSSHVKNKYKRGL